MVPEEESTNADYLVSVIELRELEINTSNTSGFIYS